MKKKNSTRSKKKCHISPVQPEMEIVSKTESAAENEARMDRVFDRLYRLRGSNLSGLSDEIEDGNADSREGCGDDYLFHVDANRLALDDSD
jgi:hypothetical protein